MASAGILQLESVGLQNVVLTSNPQVSFFRKVYKRHTPFAIETIEQQFNESVDFNKTVKCKVSRAADLIGGVYLHVTLPALSVPSGSTYIGWTNSIGYALIDHVTISIGGQEICRHYGIWMEIWEELTTEESKRNGTLNMVGKYEILTSLETNALTATTYNVPLQFWFCRRPELFLPVIALQHHDIEIAIKLRPFQECVTYDGSTAPSNSSITSASLYVDYVYLGEQERNFFKTKPLMYLIDQLQFNIREQIDASITTHTTRLEFNHAIKELQWVFVETDSVDNNDHFNFSRRSDVAKLMSTASMKTENLERFFQLDESYFRQLQPLNHHTRIPLKYIYCYSFAFNPEDRLSPSGTMNFSRYDNITMQFTMNTSNPAVYLYVYAINHNCLVIANGMAALAFST